MSLRLCAMPSGTRRTPVATSIKANRRRLVIIQCTANPKDPQGTEVSNGDALNQAKMFEETLQSMRKDAKEATTILERLTRTAPSQLDNELRRSSTSQLAARITKLWNANTALNMKLPGYQATSVPSEPEDDTRMYSNITLYMLSQAGTYAPIRLRQTTRQRFLALCHAISCTYVVLGKQDRIASLQALGGVMPIHVEDIQLKDDMELSVVATVAFQLQENIKSLQADTAALEKAFLDYQDMVVGKQEEIAAVQAWRLLAHEEGASIFRHKTLELQVAGQTEPLEVELHGAAYSLHHFIVVERMQLFNYEEVWNFVFKLAMLRKFIRDKAPHTDQLQGKVIKPYIMAGSWTSDAGERAAIRQMMQANGIQPLMPDGSGWEVSWGGDPPQVDGNAVSQV